MGKAKARRQEDKGGATTKAKGKRAKEMCRKTSAPIIQVGAAVMEAEEKAMGVGRVKEGAKITSGRAKKTWLQAEVLPKAAKAKREAATVAMASASRCCRNQRKETCGAKRW